ncbi:MAG: hypothetical protein JWM47_2521 [Acidimicrobiales bacterium]|nr:hypothetical protein [Acidimicrobiales bacterium]
MRRSSSVLAIVCALLLASCGTSDDGASSLTTTTTTSSSTTTAPSTSTTTEATTTTVAEREPACTSYTKIVGLYDSLESIAMGAAEGQDSAQDAWDEAVASLQTHDGGSDVTLAASLTTLARLDFHVTEDATGAPTEQELMDAFTTLDGTYGTTCGAEGEPTECPAPETLDAEGYTCDDQGNLTPVGPTECPAPETLDAEGYTCDSEGYLTPIDEEPTGTVKECPTPAVLEQTHFTCDSEGNLTPTN